jgi:hypothetical protein
MHIYFVPIKSSDKHIELKSRKCLTQQKTGLKPIFNRRIFSKIQDETRSPFFSSKRSGRQASTFFIGLSMSSLPTQENETGAIHIRQTFIGTFYCDTHGFEAGLPDFSWYNIPKLENTPKRLQKIPNGHKIHEMAVK